MLGRFIRYGRCYDEIIGFEHIAPTDKKAFHKDFDSLSSSPVGALSGSGSSNGGDAVPSSLVVAGLLLVCSKGEANAPLPILILRRE